MALKHSFFKDGHWCFNMKCEQEIACQSGNYKRKYKICEQNNRTKEARPQNFLLAPSWFYIQGLNVRGENSKICISI